MKIKFIFFIALIFSVLWGCTSDQSVEKIEDLTILHLIGNDYQRGLKHGQILQAQIVEIVKRWKTEVEKTYEMDFDKVVTHFYENTGFMEQINIYCPDLLDEIRGISDGSGIDYETMLAFQLSEEIDALSDKLKGNHCTSISFNRKEDNPTLLAQNMDPPEFLHGFPTLLHMMDDANETETYIYTVPGFLGLTGMNAAGVGITCDGISMLNHSTTGLPVSFIVRSVLQMKSDTAAFRFLENIPIGIPQCFTIGGKTEARCFECSANQKSLFYPYEQKNITLHTNFSVANRDFSEEFINLLKEYGKTVDDPYFCPRYFLAYDKIVEANFELSVATIKSILSLTEPEIHPISNNNTYGCLVMELSENPVLYIAPGRPSEKVFVQLSF